MNTNIEKYQKIAQSRGSDAKTAKGIIAALKRTKPARDRRLIHLRGYKPTRSERFYLRYCNASTERRQMFLESKNLYPYKVSQSSWAGGEHRTYWYISDDNIPCAGCTTEKAWSKNGKWSGTNTKARIFVTQRAVSILRGDMVIGGLVTLDIVPIGPREYKAVWAEQERGYGLKTVSGYIIKGYHVSGDSIDVARRKVRIARAVVLRSVREERAKTRSKRKEVADYKTVFVSVEDSIEAGNCIEGTMQMKRRIEEKLGGDVGAVRADIILMIDSGICAKRAVRFAASRH